MSELDILFISFDESNADKNWLELKKRFPRSTRVHGVPGIYEAHRMAAEKSRTQFFFVVDGDNRIHKDFQFSYDGISLEENSVYVWRCHNPMCDLTYGYGAVKLYNKSLFTKHVDTYVDLATTIGAEYRIIHKVASSTYFFNTPEEAWRGAFRETAKLSSQSIQRQKSKETIERLEKWKNIKETEKNSIWCQWGVKMGLEFGEKITKDASIKSKINDYKWLKTEFNKLKERVSCE